MPPQYPGHPSLHDPGGDGGDVGPGVGGDGGDGGFGDGGFGDGGPKLQLESGSHLLLLSGRVPLGQQNAPPES